MGNPGVHSHVEESRDRAAQVVRSPVNLPVKQKQFMALLHLGAVLVESIPTAHNRFHIQETLEFVCDSSVCIAATLVNGPESNTTRPLAVMLNYVGACY